MAERAQSDTPPDAPRHASANADRAATGAGDANQASKVIPPRQQPSRQVASTRPARSAPGASDASSPLAQRLTSVARYWGFRAAAAILSRLPERLVYGSAPLGGFVFWRVAPKLRSRAEANLRHIPGLAGDQRALRRAVRGVFYYATLNYIDLLRGARLDAEQVRRICTVENEADFDALIAQGRGMVLFVPHTSGWELAGALLHAKGVQVAVPAERVEPPELFSFLQRTRERHGVRILPADSRETLHAIVQVIKEGGVVVFVVDRHVNGASSLIPFFGEPARMPVTPAALALRLGVPVGMALPFRLALDRIHLPFIALREGTPQGAAGAKGANAATGETAEQLHRAFLEQVEGFLLTHPEQWVSALSPVWPGGSDEAR